MAETLLGIPGAPWSKSWPYGRGLEPLDIQTFQTPDDLIPAFPLTGPAGRRGSGHRWPGPVLASENHQGKSFLRKWPGPVNRQLAALSMP